MRIERHDPVDRRERDGQDAGTAIPGALTSRKRAISDRHRDFAPVLRGRPLVQQEAYRAAIARSRATARPMKNGTFRYGAFIWRMRSAATASGRAHRNSGRHPEQNRDEEQRDERQGSRLAASNTRRLDESPLAAGQVLQHQQPQRSERRARDRTGSRSATTGRTDPRFMKAPISAGHEADEADDERPLLEPASAGRSGGHCVCHPSLRRFAGSRAPRRRPASRASSDRRPARPTAPRAGSSCSARM